MILTLKGKKMLFCGYEDPDKIEGGLIDYQGMFTFEQAVEYTSENGFDWAHLAEFQFGEPVIVCFMDGFAEVGAEVWVIPSKVTDDDLT